METILWGSLKALSCPVPLVEGIGALVPRLRSYVSISEEHRRLLKEDKVPYFAVYNVHFLHKFLREK